MKGLLKRVEEALGLHPVSPRDFSEMSERIFSLTKSLLSPTTLKRLWGYVREDVTPRVSTLSILARAVGRLDWDDWTASPSATPQPPSHEILSPHISVEAALEPSDRVELRWNPGRRCVIEYLGEGGFEVVESDRTRLRHGDRFRCTLIAEGEPLMLSGLHPSAGSTLREGCCYICGTEHGVSFSLVTDR